MRENIFYQIDQLNLFVFLRIKLLIPKIINVSGFSALVFEPWKKIQLYLLFVYDLSANAMPVSKHDKIFTQDKAQLKRLLEEFVVSSVKQK